MKDKRSRKLRDVPASAAKRARLRTILDSMVEAVFVVDETGRVTLTNRALDLLLERDARGRRLAVPGPAAGFAGVRAGSTDGLPHRESCRGECREHALAC